MTLFPAKQLLKRQLQLCVSEATDACAAPAPNLAQLLSDYLQCRQFQPNEAVFAAQVSCLQAWQAQRVRRTHQASLHHPLHQRAAEFVLLDAYERLDILSLAPQLARIVRYAERLFPQPLLRIADLALAINVLTAQMDQAIAEALFEEMGVMEIDEADYIQAFLSVGGVACRQQQLTLILELVQALARQADNKMVLVAFKLAKAPAYSAGFRSLYAFMATGLEVLRGLPDAVNVVEQIVEVELALNDALASGKANPLLLQA